MLNCESVAVIGLGKIGLPLAIQFASKADIVYGVDIDNKIVEKINSGEAPFPGENQIPELIKKFTSMKRLLATDRFSDVIPKSKTVVVVVPLVVDKNGHPDFASIDFATINIGRYLQKGTLISYETTLPIGTTRMRFVPILERESGLKAGLDFQVIFSPERVFTGRVFEDLKKYPKIVGGINEESTSMGVEFYSKYLDFIDRDDLNRANGVWAVHNTEAAEFVKLAETTYRDVNIGLANQFALFAERLNLDIFEIITSANSQPFSHIHQPGIAVGGHCIPIYPKMYLWNDPDARIVLSAREVNEAMPEFAVKKLNELHGNLKNQRVAILGAAYRGGVKETAFSGVHDIKKHLLSHGAYVLVHDPLYSDEELRNLGFEPYHYGEEVDAVIVHTNHPEYSRLRPSEFPKLKTIFDGRAILKISDWLHVNIHVLGNGASPSKVTQK